MITAAHNLMAANAANIFDSNNKKLVKSSEKLSSGYKINRAADDAAGLSISEKMRSQIRRLNQAAKNIEDGEALINVADGALSTVHSILGRQRELLVKAANDVNAEEDRQSIEDELTELGKELDEIFEKTEFNGVKLFQGKDTIVAGPTQTHDETTYTSIDDKKEATTTIEWIDKTVTPSDTHIDNPEHVVISYDSDYVENETINSINDDGYILYDENSSYIKYKYTDTYQTSIDKKYEKLPADSAYTRMVKPGIMVGDNGYINVQNEAGNLDLSCAMSQLGVTVDGKQLTYDLYNSSYQRTTVKSNDNNVATTTYTLETGLELSQTITLKNNNEYVISYSINNTSGVEHDVDLRLAFDALNTQTTASKSSGSSSYTLANDFASIDISASGATQSALGDISDLYGTWGSDKITDGSNVKYHTGVGYWWNSTVSDGASSNIGVVNYGPITLLKDPYTLTTTTTTTHKQETEKVTDTTSMTILPKYLNIQSGANTGERNVIRLFNLSSDKLKYSIGKDKDISAFHAANSLKHIDRIVNKISSIRSYYGAVHNRLEYTYDNDLNYSENLQSAESIIRDTDMAGEMTQFTKNNILMQAAQAMLSQANSNSQSIINLLQ